MPKGKRVTKPTALLPTQEEFDEHGFFNWVVLNASHFTCSRKIGPGQMETKQFQNLWLAIAYKEIIDLKSVYKGMVYACTSSGRSVMIGPSQYAEMLKLRGED